MFKSLQSILLFCTCLYVNTILAGSVARDGQRIIQWKQTDGTYPAADNFTLGFSKFGQVFLPSISESFSSAAGLEVLITDREYVLFNGMQAYKDRFLSPLIQLAAEPAPVQFRTFGGNEPHTAYHLCPFKYENGQYYQLISYSVKISELPASGPVAQTSRTQRALTVSKLSSGKWYKFSVTRDGLYELNASALSAAGLDVNNLDPRKIKLYTHQGGMLPEKISDFRHEDLQEISVLVTGEQDGRFDAGDRVLFYAQSPHKWVFDTAAARYKHLTNIYSDKTFVFLNAEGSNGKRMGSSADGNTLTPTASYNWFDYLELHEEERENICREGRIYHGERFDQNLSYTFNHSIQNYSAAKPIDVFYSVGAISPVNSSLSLRINDNLEDVTNLGAMNTFNQYDCYQTGGIRNASVPAASGIKLNFTYARPVSSSRAWLDFYEIHCARELRYSETFMPFRNTLSRAQSVSEYVLSGLPSAALVLDVSNPMEPLQQPLFASGTDKVFRVQNNGTLREYILSDGSTFLSPGFEGEVANQNLHGLGNYQFIIVTHPDFKEASDKLADFHRKRDGLEVLVVSPQEIYNEFSCGSQDITAIRDFFRFMYYKNTNPANQLRYAMMMGDASFDYKNKLSNNSNFVPVYESDPKLSIPNNVDYYASDDFFGYLDSTDGAWQFEQVLEIAVTRMPVATASEAMDVVNKVIRYKDAASLGEWRNNITLAADDADADWEKDFVYDFEDMAAYIDTVYRNVNVRKLYFDAYKQQNLSGSQRYPEVQEAIRKEFETGTLIFNYVGHGGEEYLASEKVIDIPLITSLKNANNLPVFFTATCEFSRFDDPLRKSAGEYVFTQPEGGSIGMFTTTRVVYAGANAALTNFFWQQCAFGKTGGRWPTMGEVYKKLKNWYGRNYNDRKFNLFADPALSMNYPEEFVTIDSILKTAYSGNTDTARALDKITIKGHIEDISGNPVSNFSGRVYPIVFDKKSVYSTLSNDLPNQPIAFSMFSNILYKGMSSVSNGNYSFTFVLPKDINYNYGYGRISMYAEDGRRDAAGHYKDLIIGGTSSTAAADSKGPEIELYIDDFNFISGGLTDASPLLLARLYDENGINTSGIGIGRDIVAIIDKGTPDEKRYVLNSFYTARLNSYTNGDLKYQLQGLKDGKHTYTLKVWDVYNNSAEASIDFNIRNGSDFAIERVLNYPNPFSNNTSFHFDHNRAGEHLKVVVTVYTLTGKVVKSIVQDIEAAESHVGSIYWNGLDEFEDRLARGVYIYRLQVTAEDGSKAEKTEKLVILN